MLLGVRVGRGVSPLLSFGLNEPLRFAAFAGRLGLGAELPEAQGVASLGERLGDIGGPLSLITDGI